jgi:hypothetical protein
MKIKKILIALSMIGVTSIGNAQWAVTNVDDTLYFGRTGIFTLAMGQLLNGVQTSVDQVAGLVEVSRKQAAQFQQDTDQRNRYALGQAAVLNKVLAIYPTLEACAELSKKVAVSGAISSSVGGGAHGGKPGSPTPPDQPKKIISEAAKQVALIANDVTNGTCSQDAVTAGTGKCNAVGNYGGSKNTPDSSVSPLAITGNTSNAEKVNVEAQDLANYSLDAAGITVANQYIINATLYNAPKVLPEDKAKKYPSYVPPYKAIMIKLFNAQQALSDIVAIRKAPTSSFVSSKGAVASDIWDAKKYHDLLGLNAPKSPSLMDIMTFQSLNDYLGVPTNTATSNDALLKALNNKMALNNFIALRQMHQQENTNILLSSLLTQAVTPTDLGAVNAQYNKIMNEK